jgi:transposase
MEPGRLVSEAARSLGIGKRISANWVKAHRAGKLRGSGGSAELTAGRLEVRRLRAELARATRKRDIPGKAAAFFAGGRR